MVAAARLNKGITRTLITANLFVDGVEEIALTQPAANLTGKANTYYTCEPNDTDIVLTFTGV